MQTLRLTAQHDVSRWAGAYPQPWWIDRVVPPGDWTVLKPDGSPLLVVVRHVIRGQPYQHTYDAVAPLARSAPLKNRGTAAGRIRDQEARGAFSSVPLGSRVGKRTATRYQPLKKDGTVSKTVYAKDAPSFFLGAADRSARYPYCRQTAYTAQYPNRTRQLLPTLATLSTLFAALLPGRYSAQQAAVAQTDPAWVLPGSVFTTVTVNRNWQTALHTDKGDLATGFGVMLCLRAGTYTGGLYVMPGFGIAVDLQAGDVLFSDVHEWHANTALQGDPARYERITLVCYYRAKMVQCGTPDEELARAKHRDRREDVG